MSSFHPLIACVLAAGVVASVPANDKNTAAPADVKDDGFKPMFNGKNLDGWVNVNCAADTFFVKGEEVITTGKPTGFLRTEKQYENFVLEMDWMHANTKEVGNSGLFVWGDPLPAVGTAYTRGIEVQVLVNLEYRDKKTNAITATSHGDLFSIWGAKCTPDRPHPLGWERCLPSENRAHGGGEWNHYKVTANDGVIKLEVNGKEVSGVSKCNPRKGYLALESEGAECHFKNIRIKELPGTNPKPEECAKVAEGHVALFNGVDLKGWKTEKDAWKVKGEKLVVVGQSDLVSENKYTNYDLIFDWKLPVESKEALVVQPSAGIRLGFKPGEGFDKATRLGSLWGPSGEHAALKEPLKAGAWARGSVRFQEGKMSIAVNGQAQYEFKALQPILPSSFIFFSAEGLEIMNVFVRELKK